MFYSLQPSAFSLIIISLAGEEDVRVAIITGAGDKAFSSGADLAEVLQTREERARQSSEGSHGMVERALDSIIHFPTPVIAMINGYALAGGCELAVNCDLRIASENAHFGMPLAKRGILLNYGLVQRLVNAMGISTPGSCSLPEGSSTPAKLWRSAWSIMWSRTTNSARPLFRWPKRSLGTRLWPYAGSKKW